MPLHAVEVRDFAGYGQAEVTVLVKRASDRERATGRVRRGGARYRPSVVAGILAPLGECELQNLAAGVVRPCALDPPRPGWGQILHTGNVRRRRARVRHAAKRGQVGVACDCEVRVDAVVSAVVESLAAVGLRCCVIATVTGGRYLQVTCRSVEGGNEFDLRVGPLYYIVDHLAVESDGAAPLRIPEAITLNIDLGYARDGHLGRDAHDVRRPLGQRKYSRLVA